MKLASAFPSLHSSGLDAVCSSFLGMERIERVQIHLHPSHQVALAIRGLTGETIAAVKNNSYSINQRKSTASEGTQASHGLIYLLRQC